MYSLYPYPVFRRLFFPIVRLFIREIKGIKNLPQRGPYIVAANHTSAMDGFFLATIIIPRIKKKVHFFSRYSKYGSSLGNWIARRWAGCILVDPDNKAESVKDGIRFLKKEKVVAIFPEGHSHKENYLKKGKTGVARLALETKAPVIPVGISSNMATKSEKAFYETFFLMSDRMSIVIGKPIYFSEHNPGEITKESVEKVTRKIMKKIEELSRLPYNY